MFEPGAIINRFEVLDLLGSGNIADVYLVRDRASGALHALKVVVAMERDAAQRLLREGTIQFQLHHPNLVAVTDVIEVDGHPALVMEHVEGSTLEALLAERGALPVDECLALFNQMIAAVAMAHASGVLHRDLKPANILLAPGLGGYIVKVTDFGLAKMLDSAPTAGGLTVQGMVLGSPGYMAPEQMGDSSTADARADVFALGALLYQMLTGAGPFTGKSLGATLRNTLQGAYIPLDERRPGLPPHLGPVIATCLAGDRTLRFADARALGRAVFGEEVDDLLPSAPLPVANTVRAPVPEPPPAEVPAAQAAAAPPETQGKTRFPTLLVPLVLVAVALVAAGLYFG